MLKMRKTPPFLRETLRRVAIISLALFPLCGAARAQDVDRVPAPVTTVVPQQVRFEGRLPGRAGDVVEAVFRVYAAAKGGEPLWSETQRVAVGADGGFAILLGGASATGLPQTVFAGGEARWLGVSVEQAPEGERVLLASVPYAMKAADSETLGGVPATQFVTQAQLGAAQAMEPGVGTAIVHPDTTPSGGGIANQIPLWIDAQTLGSSGITQIGTKSFNIGINTHGPVSTLDVNGTTTVRRWLNLPPLAAATAALPQNSASLELGASSFNSGTAKAVTNTFSWQAVGMGNNTAAPFANLNLNYAAAGGNAVWTGVSIGNTGNITFAPGQTFPGTGTLTGVTTTSPLTGGGTTGAVALGLDTGALTTAISPTLQATYNGVYAQLGAANAFAGGQTINGNTVISGINTPGPALMVTNQDSSGMGIEATVPLNNYSTGVLGALSNSTALSGSYGLLYYLDGFEAGVWADAVATTGGNTSALIATGDDVFAGNFFNNSASHSTISVLNNYSGGPTGNVSKGIGTVLRASGPGGMCGINQGGSLACTGQVKTVVASRDGARQVETYSVQSAENWIEDYGSGRLSGGGATVTLEPAFADTVNTDVEFHVFLTPGGDCKGLYVTNKTATSFEVHELGGGSASIPFDYKIVAKRRGMEAQRLVDVTARMKSETEAATFKPVAHPLARKGVVRAPDGGSGVAADR